MKEAVSTRRLEGSKVMTLALSVMILIAGAGLAWAGLSGLSGVTALSGVSGDGAVPSVPGDNYLRPGGVDRYRRPDGTSGYLRP